MSEAKIRITAKDDTKSAFRTAVANINSLKDDASGLAESFAGLAGIAGGLSVAGLVAFTKSVIDNIDALNDVADATGASIENISALEDVAARTGTKFETVSSALVKFNSILNSAEPESGAAAALKAIGLEADNLKQLDPAEALRQTAVALSFFADDGNKARIVQELFGKSVKEAAPFLKDLAEQSRLVGTVTKEQVAEAEKFNKELFNMQKTITDVSRALAGPLVAAINESIEKFRQGAKDGKNFYEVIRQEQLKFLGLDTTAQDYADQLATVNARLASSNPSLSARNKLLQDQATLTAKLAKLNNQPDFSASNQSDAESARLARRPGIVAPAAKPKATGGGGSGSAAPRQSEAERYLETLQRQFEKTQELSTVDQLLLDIQKGRLGVVSADQQAQLLRLAEQLDGVKAQTEAEKQLAAAIKETSAAQEDFFAAVTKSDDAKQAQLANLLAATPTANLEKQRADMALLTAEFERYLDTNGEAGISEALYIEAVSARLDLTADKLATTKTLADDLNLSFTSAFEDAIVGGKGLSEVLKGLEQDIIRIITRKLVTEPLGNALSGVLGGMLGGSGFNPGNFIAGLFGGGGTGATFDIDAFDGGGYTGNGPRSGGLDGKGGFMALMHPQETVVDHTRGQSMGKNNTVNLVVNQSFAPNTSRATTMQAASDARRQLEYAGRNL